MIAQGNYAPVTKSFINRYFQLKLIDTLVLDSEEYWEAIALLGELILEEEEETDMFDDNDMVI